MKRRRILFLQRAHPDDVRARESLDAALVAAIFEQTVTLLFREEGVLQLIAGGRTAARRELTAVVESLPEYGVQSVYACARSLRSRGLRSDELILPASVIGVEEQGALLAGQHAVVND